MLDAGNLLLHRKYWRRGRKPAKPADAKELARRKARAALIAQAYRMMNVQAVAVGALDLVLGVPLLKTLMRQHQLQLISANLQDPQGRRIFPASKVLNLGGIKVGVLGLTGQHPIYKDILEKMPVKLGDPVEAAREQVKALRQQGAQLVMAVASVDTQQAREIAQKVQGLDFMFVSGNGRQMERLERRGDTYITEVTREGKYIGHLRLHIRGGKLSFDDLSQRLVAEKHIVRLDKSLQRMRQQQKRMTRGRTEWIAKRLERAERSREQMAQQLYRENQKQAKGSFLTHVLEPCDAKMPQDKAIAALMDQATQAADLRRQGKRKKPPRRR